jgi:hypothetical protein
MEIRLIRLRTVFVLAVVLAIGWYIGRRNDHVRRAPIEIHAERPPLARIIPVNKTRLIDRIVYRDVTADTVIRYREKLRVDTLFGGWPTTMLSLRKKRTTVEVYALSLDSSVSRWSFSGVGGDFTAWCEGEDVRIRGKRKFPIRVGLSLGVSRDGDAFVEGEARWKRIAPFVRASSEDGVVWGVRLRLF